MSSKQYWLDRLPFLLCNIFCMIALSLFLRLIGNSYDSILLILLVWLAVLAAWLCHSFLRRKRQMENLMHLTEQLKERYLIADVMELPRRADDQIFYRILKMAEKSMLEEIGAVKRERQEYKEYMEQWVHEVKTPITAIKLLCENNRTPLTKELLSELEKVDRFTELTLYYARSEHTEKDYSIREISLFEAVHQAIADNKCLLLQNGVSLNIEDDGVMVYSDDKWVRFILNQLIANAVKYRSEQPCLHLFSRQEEGQINLYIEDNGIGIENSDLPRIFEKGFTGSNGRKEQSATGIGLYLCKRLCDKLDIGITVSSDGNGTTVAISFRINYFIHQVQG